MPLERSEMRIAGNDDVSVAAFTRLSTERPAEASSTSQHAKPNITTVIRPPTGWQLVNFRELWRCRELLYFLTWREVKVRYKQTLLGAAWAILQPAMMMVVFTVF